MGPIAHVVQTALECTRLHVPVLLFQFCMTAKIKTLHGVHGTTKLHRSDRMLIKRPVHRKCDRSQKGKSWFILVLISIL